MSSVVVFMVILILIVVSVAENGIVKVSVNSYSLNFARTNGSVSYVGEANYNYEDGEDLYVSCEKEKYVLNTATLRLEYYNAEGTPLFKTMPGGTLQSQIFFRSQLKSINDKYYLDCIRADGDPEKEYRYRTRFYVKRNSVPHALILSINGQKLTGTRNNNKPLDEHYLFRYIDGDKLNILCRKTDITMRGLLKFSFYDGTRSVEPEREVRNASEGSVSLNISKSNLKRINLTCSNIKSNIQNQNPTASLSFVSDISEYDVRVKGLSTNNILYQYTNGINRWTIEYQYSVNETLNLTCVGKGSLFVENQQFQWEFNGESLLSAASLSSTMVIDAKIIFSKTLNPNHTGKVIRCVYIPNDLNIPNKTVEIILRLKTKAVIKESEDGEIISGLDNKTLSVDSDGKASQSFILLGSSIAAGLVVLAVTGAAFYCMRTRNERRRTKIQKPMNCNEDSASHNNSVYDISFENDNYHYDVCRDVVESNNDTTNVTYENVQNIDPEEHIYTEILDFPCRPGT